MSEAPINRPEDVVVMFRGRVESPRSGGCAALFDEDAEFVNVTGLWWHTRDEIRSAHAYGLTRIFKDSSLQATDVRVKRLSDEIAVVHAHDAHWPDFSGLGCSTVTVPPSLVAEPGRRIQ
jgi:hypothetical protein